MTDLLASRRRGLYPDLFLEYDDEDDNTEDSVAKGNSKDALGVGLRGQPEEEELRMMSKKDLESLVYQANPALTVAKLPEQPIIDFR